MDRQPQDSEAEQNPFVGLPDQELRALQETLQYLIGHIDDRIHYAESRRAPLVVAGGGLFAGSLALISLVLPNVSYPPLRFSLIIFGVCGVLVSAATWFLYARQTNFKYPFTKATKTWKWFYRDALPNQEAFKVPIHTFQSRQSFEHGKQAFTSQWEQFKQNQVPGLRDLATSVYQDLQQLYVLHVNEFYKNRFLTHLRSVLSVGLLVSLALSVAVFVILWLADSDGVAVSSGVHVTPFVTVQSSWRPTGQTRSIGVGGKEVQLLVNYRIQNKGSTKLLIASVVPKDSVGLRIPIFVESLSPTPISAAPNSTVDAMGLIWIPSALVNSLHRFEASR